MLAAIVLMTAQPFAVAFTQNTDGGYDYMVLSVSLLSETTKLLVSLGLYARLPPGERTHHLLSRRDVLQFAIPAVLFALNNALLFAIVSSIRPALFQLLSTTKTVFTAILFRLVLRRELTITQQAAVVILAAGAAVSRLNSGISCELSEPSSGSGEFEDFGASLFHGEWYGVLLTLVTCVSSSFGGVVNEALLKKDGAVHALCLQNALLYVWGILVNAVALGVRSGAQLAEGGLFAGYAAPVALLDALVMAPEWDLSDAKETALERGRSYARAGAGGRDCGEQRGRLRARGRTQAYTANTGAAARRGRRRREWRARRQWSCRTRRRPAACAAWASCPPCRGRSPPSRSPARGSARSPAPISVRRTKR